MRINELYEKAGFDARNGGMQVISLLDPAYGGKIAKEDGVDEVKRHLKYNKKTLQLVKEDNPEDAELINWTIEKIDEFFTNEEFVDYYDTLKGGY